MPVEDAVSTNIDYQAMAAANASAMVSALMQTGVVGQKQDPVSKMSAFEKQLEEIEKNPESDKGTVATLKSLFQTFKTDLEGTMSAKQSEEAQKQMKQQRDTTARALILKSIEDATPEDSIAARYKAEIMNKIITTFNTSQDKEYVEGRKKYESGEIDIKLLNKMIKAEVDGFSGSQPQSKSSTGMQQRDKQSESAAALSSKDNEGGENFDPADFSQKERDIYYARLGVYQRTKPGSRDTKEAKAYAFNGVKNMRNSKHKEK